MPNIKAPMETSAIKQNQSDPIDNIMNQYRDAGDARRLEMFLFYRELRDRFDSIEREETHLQNGN